MSNVVIRADGLSKRYRISHRRSASNSSFSGGAKKQDFWALKDISFEVERGEVVGIIGRNGAGKSTLLKILSRITDPTEGKARIRGRVTSLLEVGTGFHPELTGRENLFLNGSILGMTRAEIRKKFDEIVSFAEIDQFLDTPVKRYSSGMYVRLAFSVAAHLEPEVLVVDEALAVGDVGFQRKCMDHMKKLARSGVTILMVSHNLFAVKAMCHRILMLSAGRLEFDGAPTVGIDLYEKNSRSEANSLAVGVIGEDVDQSPMAIRRIELLDEKDAPRAVYEYGERMRARIHYEIRRPVRYPNFYLGIRRSDNITCCSYSAARDGVTAPFLDQSGMIELLTPPLRLVSDAYSTYTSVWDHEFKSLYCEQIGPNFHVSDEVLNEHFGVFHVPAEWRWGVNGDGKQVKSLPFDQLSWEK